MKVKKRKGRRSNLEKAIEKLIRKSIKKKDMPKGPIKVEIFVSGEMRLEGYTLEVKL
jgi:hypothetical protein